MFWTTTTAAAAVGVTASVADGGKFDFYFSNFLVVFDKGSGIIGSTEEWGLTTKA